ncbi:MAG: tetratricopeptide repeat protein [bacterium]
MSTREKIVLAARRHIEQGRLDLAIREFERLSRLDPGDLRTRVQLGMLCAKARDVNGAVRIYLDVANTYEQKGGIASAATVLQQVLVLQPHHVEVRLWLAELYKDLGRPAESRQELELALQQFEEDDQPEDALRVLEDMLDLDPGNVALCIRLGEAYAALDRIDEAVDTLSRAADVLRLAEWMDDFIRVAERLLWLDPDNLELARELATIYLRQREPQLALQRLQRCYESNREDPETLKLLSDAFIDLREPEKAATILGVLAEVYERKGETERCESVMVRVAELDSVRYQQWALEREEAARHPGREQDTVPLGKRPEPRALELGDDDQSWNPPALTGETDLRALEMSLQSSGPEDGGPKRFLPAVTAHTQTGVRNVTTTELQLSELEFLDSPPRVTTEELDLSDLEDVASLHSVTTEELDPSEAEELAPPRNVTTEELDLGDLQDVQSVHNVTTEELDLSEHQDLDAPGREGERFVTNVTTPHTGAARRRSWRDRDGEDAPRRPNRPVGRSRK